MVKPATTTTVVEPNSEQTELKYKGVRKRKWGKWVSEVRLPNSRERIWLGSYDTPEKAARAFDAALFCLRGPDAKFNFPDTPLPDIINVVDRNNLSPQEIQELAARFANEEPQPQPPKPKDNDFLAESSCSQMGTSSVSDGGGAVIQVVENNKDMMAMDWSFLNLLDSNVGASDFDLFSGMDGELYCPPPPPVEDNGDENCGDAFTQQSFLWNFDNC